MNFLQLEDGRRLAYRAAGSGPPLVLLHGWAMSSAVFAEALDEFSDRFRVFAPDLRGHGGSAAAHGYGLGDFAADLEEWFGAMDLRDVTLLGWSLGGQVVLELYPAIRSRVSRLILVGTTPRFTAATDWTHGLAPIQVRAMTRDLKRNYLSTMENFFNSQFAEEEISRERFRRVVDFAVRGGCLPVPEVALAALATLQSADLRGRMAAIDCPVFLLHGEQDRITLPGASRFMVEHLPRARLSLLVQAGHAPFLSRPEECFRLWREFLP